MATKTWNGANGNWGVGTNWTGGLPGSSDTALVSTGNPQVTTTTPAINVGGLITTGSGDIQIHSTTVSNNVAGTAYNAGRIEVDDNGGEGGSVLSIGSKLTNTGSIYVGNSGATMNSEIYAASLSSTGSINLYGGTTAGGYLQIGSAVGFGVAGTLTGAVNLSGYSYIGFASGSLSTIARGAKLTLNGPSAKILGGGTDALGTLSINAGEFDLANGSSETVSSALTNSGIIQLDQNGGQGGGQLTVSNTLTNSGTLNVGNSSLATADGVTVNGLSNSGTINVSGNTNNTVQAALTVNTTAGFGVANTLTGTVNLFNDALIQFSGTQQITTIANGGTLLLDGTMARVALSSNTSGNTALTGLTTVNGDFELRDGASVTTAAGLTNTGTINLDRYGGQSSSQLTLGSTGVLTNSGTVSIGNSSLLSPDGITAAGLANTGSISLYGNSSYADASHRALLTVTGASGFGTLGTVTGNVGLYGDTEIHFGSGTLNTIATGATLTLDGADAVISNNSTATNSALAGLTTINGDLELRDSASVTTTAGLTNTASLFVDRYGSQGGSHLALGSTGVLNNSGTLSIGNTNLSSADGVTAAGVVNTGAIDLTSSGSYTDAAHRALLTITGAAGFGQLGTVSGTVALLNDSEIHFGSGMIKTVASGAALTLDGADAVISNDGTFTNSALAGLTTINGDLELRDGASVTTTSGLINTGTLNLDRYGGEGSAQVALSSTGALRNSGTLSIGNYALSSADSLTAAQLLNTGTVVVTGNQNYTDAAHRALLNITGVAGFNGNGVVNGSVFLQNDAEIHFGSGTIKTVSSGATLTLDGADAVISNDSTATNSALAGLTTINGDLELRDGSSVTTTAGLSNTNLLVIDRYGGESGSQLSLGATGVLNNSGTLSIGNYNLSTGDGLTAAGLINTGTLNVTGSAYYSDAAHQALLNITGAAGFGQLGTVTGSVSLAYDAQVHFGSGTINAIASGSTLSLNGADAVISNDATATNSALTGLNRIAGELDLSNGASITTSGGLANSGTLRVDQYNNGGSSLTLGGSLTNTGNISIGTYNLATADGITASTLVNNGTIEVQGSNSVASTLHITGNTAGTGTDTIDNGGVLQFDGNVYAGQNIGFSGPGGELLLNSAQTFGATVSGFQANDTIDLHNFSSAAITSYAPTPDNTGGTLLITSGTQHASISFAGNYSAGNFGIQSDNHGGSNLIFQPLA